MQKLSSELEDINGRMSIQQRYAKYFPLIDKNEPKNVVITNQDELLSMKNDASSAMAKLQETMEEQRKAMDSLTLDNSHMKKYIMSLEQEVNLKTK